VSHIKTNRVRTLALLLALDAIAFSPDSRALMTAGLLQAPAPAPPGGNPVQESVGSQVSLWNLPGAQSRALDSPDEGSEYRKRRPSQL